MSFARAAARGDRRPPARARRVLGLAALALVLVAAPRPDAQTAPLPGETWMRYVAPADAGFSATGLADARAIFDRIGSAAVMVVSRGAVVAAWGEVDRRFMCQALRKSLISMLCGVAADAGSIDLESTLGELELASRLSLSERERSARVRDLLTGRSGVYLPAAYEPPEQAADRPPRNSHVPGTRWWPGSWDVNALAAIIEDRTGLDLFVDFDRDLAVPLGLEDWRLRDGTHHAEPALSPLDAPAFRLSARDLARLGLLLSRGGSWGGERILSRTWVATSTTRHSFTGGSESYGYQWWIAGARPFSDLGMFSALSEDGQSLDVLPTIDLVFVHRVDGWAGERISAEDRLALLEAILQARTGEPVDDPRLVPLELDPRPPVASLPPERLDELAGTYTSPLGLRFEVRREGSGLLLDLHRQGGVFALLPQPDGGFVLEDARTRLYFEEQVGGHRRLILEPLLEAEGRVLQDQQRLSEAIATLRRAVRYYPESARAHQCLGHAYEEHGDVDEALRSFRRCLEIDPDDGAARRALERLQPTSEDGES